MHLKYLALSLLAFTIVSGRASAAETRSPTPGSPPPAARIDDLAWLTGTWAGEGLGGQAIEVYSGPAGGQMVGHFRQADKGGIRFYELVSIAENNGTLTYRIKHFNPDLTGWEEKAQVVSFPLVAVEPDVWFFDGLTLRRTGPDTMVETVRISDKGEPDREATFTYRRLAP